MPCDSLEQYRLEERRRIEQERERELARIEQELASGIAQIIVSADGTVMLMAELPAGMQEACVLAGLQRRSSQEFQQACYNAGVFDMNFIQLHGNSHRH